MESFDRLLAADSPGYWTGAFGFVPSTVQWCESNYEVCHFIAEFFNTVSSLSILAAGLIGMIYTRRLEQRWVLAYATIATVGIGSVLFHMTLLRPMQMLDEVPMLWAVIVMVYCIIETDAVRPKYGRALPIGMFAYAVFVTLLTSLSSGHVQFLLFHASFGSLEFWSLGAIAMRARRETDPTLCRLYRRGFSAYAIALVCWASDIHFCESLQRMWPANPQLHALWHVFVSAGLYILTVCTTHARLRVLAASSGDSAATIEWMCYVLPVARLKATA